jgi:ABC-type cobalamin/Fe3+-siderophores transport system ATPase subunit
MSNEAVALSIQGLTAGYGGPPIIEQISLTARRGAITAIVGPTGLANPHC